MANKPLFFLIQIQLIGNWNQCFKNDDYAVKGIISRKFYIHFWYWFHSKVWKFLHLILIFFFKAAFGLMSNFRIFRRSAVSSCPNTVNESGYVAQFITRVGTKERRIFDTNSKVALKKNMKRRCRNFRAFEWYRKKVPGIYRRSISNFRETISLNMLSNHANITCRIKMMRLRNTAADTKAMWDLWKSVLCVKGNLFSCTVAKLNLITKDNVRSYLIHTVAWFKCCGSRSTLILICIQHFSSIRLRIHKLIEPDPHPIRIHNITFEDNFFLKI
jgi:hypothetical protein